MPCLSNKTYEMRVGATAATLTLPPCWEEMALALALLLLLQLGLLLLHKGEVQT